MRSYEGFFVVSSDMNGTSDDDHEAFHCRRRRPRDRDQLCKVSRSFAATCNGSVGHHYRFADLADCGCLIRARWRVRHHYFSEHLPRFPNRQVLRELVRCRAVVSEPILQHCFRDHHFLQSIDFCRTTSHADAMRSQMRRGTCGRSAPG